MTPITNRLLISIAVNAKKKLIFFIEKSSHKMPIKN